MPLWRAGICVLSGTANNLPSPHDLKCIYLHKFLDERSPVRNASGKLILSPHTASKSPCWFGNSFVVRQKVTSFAASSIFFASRWLLKSLTVNWVGLSLGLVQITMHTAFLCFTVSVPEFALLCLPKGIANTLIFSLYFIYGKKKKE